MLQDGLSLAVVRNKATFLIVLHQLQAMFPNSLGISSIVDFLFMERSSAFHSCVREGGFHLVSLPFNMLEQNGFLACEGFPYST